MQCTWDSLYLTNWDAGTAIITIRGLCYPQLVTGALMMPLQQCHAGRAAIVQKLVDPVPVFAWGHGCCGPAADDGGTGGGGPTQEG